MKRRRCQAQTNHHPMGQRWSATAHCSRDEGHHPKTMHRGEAWAGGEGFTVLWRTEPNLP